MKLFGNSNLKFCLLSLVMMAGSINIANAQTKSMDGQLSYPQQAVPIGLDFFHFSTYYFSGSGVYNIGGQKLGDAVDNVVSLKVNPSGISYATLTRFEGRSLVTVSDLWQSDNILREFYEIDNATAICYTPDGKQLLIAVPNKLEIYNATYHNYVDQMAMPFSANLIEVSPDGRDLVAAKSNQLAIFDLQQKLVFKSVEMSATVNDVAFSADNSKMAVVTADGKLSIYSTSDFRILQTFGNLGNAGQCSFHPDGNFVAVVVSNQRVVLLSLDDNEYRSYIDSDEGGISSAQFVLDGKKQVYLVYNTKNNIVYKPMDGEYASVQSSANSKVVDGSGTPLAGALVEFLGIQESTLTELDGTFSLPTSSRKYRVRASYVGMQSKTKSAKKDMTIKLTKQSWLNDSPESYEWVTTLQGAFPESGFSNPSLGVMVGRVKNIGWYVKGVYSPVKSTDSEYDGSRWTTGKSKNSYWAATAGAIVRVKGPFHIYLGGGYVDRKIAWELSDGSYAKYADQSYNGATLDYGVMFKMNHLVITGGAMTNLTGDCYFTGCIGVGVSF